MNEMMNPARIERRIYLIRGYKVMMDRDLAELYGVKTKVLIQAVKRNRYRFPDDFMLRLTEKEFRNLRSQIVTSSWGGRRHRPYLFTEHGIAMLSSVLNSKRAILINISIMRAFARLRHFSSTRAELANKVKDLEIVVGKHDRHILGIVQAIKQLVDPKKASKRPIGFGN